MVTKAQVGCEARDTGVYKVMTLMTFVAKRGERAHASGVRWDQVGSDRTRRVRRDQVGLDGIRRGQPKLRLCKSKALHAGFRAQMLKAGNQMESWGKYLSYGLRNREEYNIHRCVRQICHVGLGKWVPVSEKGTC